MTKSLDDLYNSFPIKKKYNDPDNSEQKYPPDWNYRQAAVMKYHNETCARCRRRVGSNPEVLQFHIHHVLPLHKGGTHELENLVPLCEHCHALIHPYKEELGDVKQAPLFPANTADHRVAVERVPKNNIERTIYDMESSKDQVSVEDDVNIYARSEETTNITAQRAIKKQNPTSEKLNNITVKKKFDFFCNDCGVMLEPGEVKCESCSKGSTNVRREHLIIGALIILILLIIFIIFFFA